MEYMPDRIQHCCSLVCAKPLFNRNQLDSRYAKRVGAVVAVRPGTLRASRR